MKNRHGLLLLLLVSLILVSPGFAQEWTRFRGPNGEGISHCKTIPTKWTDKDFRWKIELPGKGHSSPVVWGDRVFVTSAEPVAPGGFHTLCFSAANGSKLWQRDFPLGPFKKNPLNSFASATPAVDAERVYVSWGTTNLFMLAAFDHAGKTVWERDLGPFVSQHGPAVSPVLYDGRVILGNEQDGASFLIAVDARTGKTLWQTPRKGGDQTTAYSVPCMFHPKNGKPVLIFNSRNHGISGVDPATGAVVWDCPVLTARSVSSPFICENAGLVFGTCGGGGVGSHVAAVRPGDPAKGEKAQEAYRIKKPVAPYVPTSLVVGDVAYLWTDQGLVSCITAATGEVRWQQRTKADANVKEGFFASPIWVDGRVFNVSRDGEVVVIEASPDHYKELFRFPLGETAHATPAVSGGRMFLRTESHLFCLGGEKR